MSQKVHENQVFEGSRLYRLPQIVGAREVDRETADENRERGKGRKTPREEIPARIPISRAGLYLKIKAGEFPSPVRLGPRTVAWRGCDLNEWLEKQK
ncbi:MAG: AlpA family phage regulatory protein [Deltaproteobacteria bacterium]|nr:AlpA family phage regulatory protein [Deltaproteobacteria bacterium]